jgi:hypothetical protein
MNPTNILGGFLLTRTVRLRIFIRPIACSAPLFV